MTREWLLCIVIEWFNNKNIMYKFGKLIRPFVTDDRQGMWLIEIDRVDVHYPDYEHEGCIEIRADSQERVEFLAKCVVDSLNRIDDCCLNTD